MIKRLLALLFFVVSLCAAGWAANAAFATDGPPANDNFVNATVITGRTGTLLGSSVGATYESGDPVGPSVWYAWTAPASGTAHIDLCGAETNFDTYLAVGHGSTRTELGSTWAYDDDSACGLQSAIDYPVEAGQPYRIDVGGYGGSTGTFRLNWNIVPTMPTNDDLANARVLDPAMAGAGADNTLATKENGEPDHAGNAGGHSLWFSWTAPRTDSAVFETPSSDFDTLLAVYTQSGTGFAGLTPVASNDDVSGADTTSRVQFAATAGSTYLIAVDGKDGATGNVVLHYAEPPANDALAGAIVIDHTMLNSTDRIGSTTGSNFLASKESGEPNHAGDAGGASVWYRWQAVDNGLGTIDLAGSDFDTVLGVYTGGDAGVGGLHEVSSNDDAAAGTTTSRTSFVTSAGTIYYIAVDGKAGVSGSVHLSWKLTPVNDDRANATAIAGAAGTMPGTNVGATGESGDPDVTQGYWGGTRTVWYRWTAPASGGVQFRLQNQSGFNYSPSVGGYTETLGAAALAPKQERDWQYYGGFPTSRFSVVEGVTYLIGVDSPSIGTAGTFDLQWTSLPRPDNDDFAAATVVGPGNGSTNFDNHWSTLETGEPAHPGAVGDGSVWYSWTPDRSGTARINVSGYNFDPSLGLYAGSDVAALTEVASNDNEPQSGWNSRVRVPVTAGTTYHFSITSAAGQFGNGTVSWDVVDTPANDDLANAQTLALPSGDLTNLGLGGALLEPNEPKIAGRNGGASLWYRFTAPAEGGTFRFWTGETYYDSFAAAYTGDQSDMTTLSAVASSDNAPGQGYSPILLLRTTPGQQYFVAFDNADGEDVPSTLHWQLVPTPANDDFGGAEVISGAVGHVDGTNLGATVQPNEPRVHPSYEGLQSTWYSWTAPTSGTAVFDTNGSAFRTVLGAFTGDNLTALTNIASNDTATGNNTNGDSRLRFAAVAGTTYHVAIDGQYSASGATALSWSLDTPPANDAFSAAAALPGESGSVGGSTVGATKEPGEPNHAYASGGGSIWYRLDAPYDGAATITTAGTAGDTVLAVYQGTTVSSLSGIGYSNDVSGSDHTSALRFQMSAGQAYYIAVDTIGGVGIPTTFDYSLRPPAANDHFADAQVLPDAAGSVTGSTIGATVDPGEYQPGYPATVWYLWTAPLNGNVHFAQTNTTGTYTDMWAYDDGPIGGLSQPSGVQANWWYGWSTLDFPVTAGSTYRVVLSGYNGQTDFTLNYNVGPPVNDNFADATTLSGIHDQRSGVNLGATAEPNEPAHAGSAAASSTWYQWTAPSNGDVTIDLGTSNFDTRLAVYTGDTIDALTPVAANDDDTTAASPTTTSKVTFPATTGTAYRIAVDGKSGAQGAVQLVLNESVPELSVNDVTVNEHDGTATFTITRAGATTPAVTLHYATIDGSATAASDYTAVPDTAVTFASGETTKQVVVPIIDDALDEADGEYFFLGLSNLDNGYITDSLGQAGITDDDPLPTLTISNPTVDEGALGTTTTAHFTVGLSAPSGRSVSLTVATANGSAFTPSDYAALAPSVVTFQAGETTKDVAVTVKGDDTDEDDQTFTLVPSLATNVVIPSGTVGTATITDDDPPPDVSASDAPAVLEGDAAHPNAVFSLSLSKPSERTVTVHYATADGEARLDRGDYTDTHGSVDFAPGETSKTVLVPVLNDIYDEFDQHFTLNLSDVTNGNVVRGSGTATIQDDDVQPTIDVADASTPEGATGAHPVVLALHTSAPSEKPITVTASTTGGVGTHPASTDPAAVGGADFTGAVTSVQFAQDDQDKTFAVQVNGDHTHEYDETFGVALSAATNVTLGRSAATATIADDDTAPVLSAGDVAVTEGDAGSTQATVPLTLDAVSGRVITVHYVIGGGTATAGDDYTAGAGDVTFQPGETAKSVAVTVLGDTVDEENQTTQAALSSPVDATLGQGTATVTITDDDLPPLVRITGGGDIDEPAGSATYDVVLAIRSEKPITVDATIDDTTDSPADHGAITPAAPLSFAPGVVAVPVSVPIVDDTTDEPNQGFDVRLTGGTNVRIDQLDGHDTALTTIIDDDLPPFASASGPATVGENAGSATFTVTLTELSEWSVTVPYTVTDGTASASDHGSGSPAEASFAPGATTASISVPIVDDSTDEFDETFDLALAAGGSHVRLAADAASLHDTVTIVDDDAPPTAVLSGPATIDEAAGAATYTVDLTAASEKPITVPVALADNSASAADHGGLAPASPVTFAAGETTHQITVAITDDELDEPDETYSVSLAAGTNVDVNTTALTTTIVDDDETPVAAPVATGTAEDASATVTLSATDGDSPDLQYRIAAPPAHGTLGQLVGDQVTYTPDADFNGGDTFSYTASDGVNTSAPATVSIIVAPVNDVPAATDGTLTVAEDASPTPIDLRALVNDVETADADLTYVVGTPGVGTLTGSAAAGTLTYTPGANANGSDSFTFHVVDRGDPDGCGTAGPACADAATSADRTVTITVTPVNDVPVASDTTVVLDEDSPAVPVDLASLVGDVETATSALTFDIVTPPGKGVLGGTAGSRTYTPSANANGADSFTYRVIDRGDPDDCGAASSSCAAVAASPVRTVSFTINPVNDLPQATDDSAVTPHDTPVVIPVLANDQDVEGLVPASVQVISGAAHGATSVDPASGAVTYAPAAGYSGGDSFAYAVSDTDGSTVSATVTITVTPNAPPHASDDAATTSEDTASAPIDVLANDTDADGDALALDPAGLGPAVHGTVAIAPDGRSVVYTPDPDFNGSGSFTYTVSDGNGGSSVATVVVTVTPVNDGPTANADALTIAEDSASTAAAVLANDVDVDGDLLTVSAHTVPAHGGVACDATTCTYTPDADFNGPDSFTYTASDGHGATATATVTVTVTAVDDIPVATADTVTTSEDSPIDVAVLANDSGLGDGGITVSSQAPLHGTAEAMPGSVRYIPAPDFHGTDTFSYAIVDADGDRAEAVVDVVVTSVNDAPAAAADSASTLEDHAVDIDVLANDADVDGDPLTLAAAGPAAHGTTSIVGSSVRYTPAADYNGPDSFTYTVTDGHGGSTIATVTVAVSSASAQADAPAGGTVSTGSSATPAEPVQVAVTTPNAGLVSVADSESTTFASAGYDILGLQLDITAPAATAANPLQLVFRIDGSRVVPPASTLSQAAADVVVFRNGAAAGSCPGATAAAPDPCVSSVRVVDGDLEVTVLTSHASTWNLGVTKQAPAPAPSSAPAPAAPPSAVTPSGNGYWIVGRDGGVFAFGDAGFYGSTGGMALNKPIVGMAATPTGRGYWLVASDGGVFAFGDAAFYGSAGGIRLNSPIARIIATPTGRGYWMLANDGGVFTFGDANFFGSTGSLRLNKPIIGMAATSTGRGYWLVASDGGIFTFGDADFLGSTGDLRLNAPIVGMASTPSGRGYWLVATDGGIFTFGDAPFVGSTGGIRLNQPIAGMVPSSSGLGYWLMATDGGVFAFGDAPFLGSAAGVTASAVGMTR